jgi:hypothetical protein
MFGACHKDAILHQDGYIVFSNLDFFQFLPVKKMNDETSLSSFYSENLKRGFQFQPSKCIFDSIYPLVDTFHLQGLTSDLAKELYVLKIIPVRIDYKYIAKNKQIQTMFNIWSDTIQVRGKKIAMIYDFTQYNILKITPIHVKKRNMEGSLKSTPTGCSSQKKNKKMLS